MGSDEFFEKQAKIQQVRTHVEIAIDEIKGIEEFKDLKSYLEIVLDEVRELERRY